MSIAVADGVHQAGWSVADGVDHGVDEASEGRRHAQRQHNPGDGAGACDKHCLCEVVVHGAKGS